MKTKQLGQTDLELSSIGLGTWAIGGAEWAFGWGEQTEQDSIETILAALEGGINWIDTAPAYGIGCAEEVVGKALKAWSRPVIVATKCGLVANAKRKIKPRIKRESIQQEVEDSLRRLGTEVIDLYQIHWPAPEADIEEAFEALLKLKASGKIRWGGVCNFSASQLDTISELGVLASLQPPYSLLKREIEDAELPWCKKHDVGVIPYSPMQCGILTGKVSAEWVASLPSDDWRKKGSAFLKEPTLSAVIAFVDALKEIAKSRDYTLAELAINWVRHHPQVTSPIVGARSPTQVEALISACSWEMDEELYEEIERVFAEHKAGISRVDF